MKVCVGLGVSARNSQRGESHDQLQDRRVQTVEPLHNHLFLHVVATLEGRNFADTAVEKCPLFTREASYAYGARCQ
jgi:hypothetical protein